jgi:7-carboxy-7-deazaguanine synthase
MSINTILDEIKKYNCKTIMITGGEPLLQAKIYLLIDELIDSKYEVILETNGSISIDRVRQEVSISLDIKCPSSSENGSNNYQNLEFLKKTDLIKFVVSNKKDFDFAIKKIIEYEMYNRCDNIYFSAVTSELKLSELSEYILNLYETKHSHRNNLMITLEKIRMQIQLHKVI